MAAEQQSSPNSGPVRVVVLRDPEFAAMEPDRLARHAFGLGRYIGSPAVAGELSPDGVFTQYEEAFADGAFTLLPDGKYNPYRDRREWDGRVRVSRLIDQSPGAITNATRAARAVNAVTQGHGLVGTEAADLFVRHYQQNEWFPNDQNLIGITIKDPQQIIDDPAVLEEARGIGPEMSIAFSEVVAALVGNWVVGERPYPVPDLSHLRQQ